MDSSSFHHRFVSATFALVGALALPAVLRAHSNDPALFPAMIQAFTEEIAKAPETDLFIKRGEIYVHTREWEKAAADFAAAEQRDPDRISIKLQLSRALFESGQPAKAQPLVEHYLEQKPSQADAWFLRGQIAAVSGDPERARADYREGFRRAPDATAEQILYWSRLLRALAGSDCGEILEILDGALARLGAVPALINDAIELEVTRQNFPAALARIDRCLQEGMWPGMVLARRGDVLVKAGQQAEAVAAYGAALEAIAKLPERNRAIPEMQKLMRETRGAMERLSTL